MLLLSIDLGHIHEKTHEGTTRVKVRLKIVFCKITTCLYPDMIVLLDIAYGNSGSRVSPRRARNSSMKSFFYFVVDA